MSNNNLLSLVITESFNLQSFTIEKVTAIPNVSARIYIVIMAPNGKLYDRTLSLEGDSYC